MARYDILHYQYHVHVLSPGTESACTLAGIVSNGSGIRQNRYTQLMRLAGGQSSSMGYLPKFNRLTTLYSVFLMKKRSEATQILRAGCSKAEPKNFALPQTPFPGARDGQNVISWRWSLRSPTNPVW